MAESNAVEALDNFFEDWVSDIEYNILQTSAVPEPVEIPVRPEPKRRERKAPQRKVRIRTLPDNRPVKKTGRDRSKGLFLISAFIGGILQEGSRLRVERGDRGDPPEHRG